VCALPAPVGSMADGPAVHDVAPSVARGEDGETMTADACWARLDGAASGRLVLQRHGRPVVFLVNHVTDGRTIVFRTGANSVVGLLPSHQPVTFEVDDADAPLPKGWRVVLTGETERIGREDRDRIVPQPSPWSAGRVEAWIRIRASVVTGTEPRGAASPEGAPVILPEA
jgi:uncharacterized protein